MNDAERLAQDPAFRLIGSEKIWERGAALPSRLQSFETQMLAEDGNFAGLARLNRALVARAEALDARVRAVLDMDSTEIRVFGEQEESAYNGHFESTCYHPLLLFNRDGDCLGSKLRPGNVHSADGWEELLLPEIERQQAMGKEVVFRADAAFAKPEIYEASETRGVKFAIRMPANDSLERDIAELLLAETAAATGPSAFLIEAINEREQRLRDLSDQLLAGGANSFDAHLSGIRNFIMGKMGDLRALLAGDPAPARKEMLKYVSEIRMMLQVGDGKGHYVAQGEWRLLGNEQDTLPALESAHREIRLVAGGGFEPPTFGL
ncbi:MAG: transposase [Terriglobales bacterium]